MYESIQQIYIALNLKLASATDEILIKSYFACSSIIYNKLGHFKYNSEDFSQPIEIKYDEECSYIGHFRPGTNTLHGIGIRVSCYGWIEEGSWKDGKQEGNGRAISGFDGGYYIGTFKAGNFAKGIYYNKDGSIRSTYDEY